MRNLAIVVLVGCGSSVDIPDDHKLHDLSADTAESLHLRYGGTQVPLGELAMVGVAIGLPVSGTADVAVDVKVPKVSGRLEYGQAKGTISVGCTKCQIGDDKTKLRFGAKNARTASFLGDGIDFSHLAIDSLDAKLSIESGKLQLTSWKLASPDLELEVALSMTLATPFEASAMDGCIRFKPSKELDKRDPKMASLLMLTGANQGSDGMYHIKLEGSVGNVRRLAKECGK
jgi:type II secretion system protein N